MKNLIFVVAAVVDVEEKGMNWGKNWWGGNRPLDGRHAEATRTDQPLASMDVLIAASPSDKCNKKQEKKANQS